MEMVKFWHQPISREIFEKKYNLYQETELEVFRSISKEVASPEREEVREYWEEEFFNLISSTQFIPAGRILANARPFSKLKNYNNCFTISIKDDMQEIYNALKEDAMISKMGGGVGFNVSGIRPKGDILSRGGEASGPLSFLKVFNESAKIIMTGGQRRAAHIAIMNVDHPDIEEFITIKQGDKNKELTQFNISVGLTDAFMEAVDNDEDWNLQFDGKVYKTVKARDLYNKIAENAYEHNEPGIFNLDTVNRYNNGWYMYYIQEVNPCFTGDTIIATADGRNGTPIKQLAEENKEFNVYSARKKTQGNRPGLSKWKAEIKKATAFKTGTRKVITVNLSDGTSFKCTPDHLLARPDGSYVEARDSEGVELEKFKDENEKPIKEDLNVYLDSRIFVESIEDKNEIEDVYDLTVEDNHNFYILTNTDDDKFLNSSGCLVHNCGEQPIPAYNVCDLGAMNLTKFVRSPFTDDAYFDFHSFFKSVAKAVRFLDNVLDATDYPLEKIRQQATKNRRIGLGFTGLADAFAMLGVKYGSNESKYLSEEIGKALRDASYEASIDLAEEKGAFENFEEKFLESNFVKTLENKTQERIKKYGIRNVNLNTVAPTGTTSFSLGQNCSSGIEPIFSLQYDRKIRTGRGEETTTETVYDYAWLQYQEITGEAEAPDYFTTTMDVDPYDAIDIQAIFQKYIDASISKTANLPMGYTFDQYKDLFRYAYKRGLKGFTSFNPEGSLAGILSYSKDDKKKESELSPEYVERANASKRPNELECDIHQISVNKEKHIVLVGKLNGSLYEMFVTKNSDGKIDINNHKTGIIRKEKKGHYNLIIKNGVEKVVVDDIGKSFDNIYGSLSRFVSMSLRHGVPLQFIVEQLQKDSNFISFEKAVSRVLKKYIKEGEKVMTNQKCPECKGDLVYRDGCLSCPACGWSKCS